MGSGNNNLVYRGQKEIAAAVGINWKNFSYYIKKKKNPLPVFRIDGKGTWLAMPKDLEKWLLIEREMSLEINHS